MPKFMIWLLTVVFLLGIMPGCTLIDKPQDPVPNPTENNLITETVKLYYGDTDNEKMVTEERQITYAPGSDRYKLILEELLRGPQTAGLRQNIAAEAIVYGTIIQNEDLIVDFNEDFTRFAGSMAEAIGIGSVVNTVTQFGDLKRVKILVEGNEYIGPSGEPQGFMEPLRM